MAYSKNNKATKQDKTQKVTAEPSPMNLPATAHGMSMAPMQAQNVEQAEAIAKVQASVIVAKQFPRDELQVYSRVMEMVKHPALAEKASYAYPRGKDSDGNPVIIQGASIRLAETIANAWGNLSVGFKILEQDTVAKHFSRVQVICWDKESNTDWGKEFVVEHKRKANGAIYVLTDPRDIYEMIANQAKRRLRAAIMECIPFYVFDDAVQAAKHTLANPKDGNPIDRARKALVLFKGFGVSQQMIEKKLGHPMENITHAEVADLIAMYNGLMEGGKVADYFEVPKPKNQASDVNSELDKEIHGNADNGKTADATPGAGVPRADGEGGSTERGATDSGGASAGQHLPGGTVPKAGVQAGVGAGVQGGGNAAAQASVDGKDIK